MSTEAEFQARDKAKRQYDSGNFQGAVDTLEDYLVTDPHNLKVRLILAQYIIYGLKQREYGMMQLDVILDIDPEYVDALLAKITVMSEDKRNNKQTNELYQKLVEAKPSAEMYASYARFLRNQMVDFKRSGEYYEKAIEIEPNRYEYHQNYSVLLLNDLKDYPKAKSELELLMQMKPNDMTVKNNYDRLMREKFDKNGNPVKPRFGLFRR